MSLELTAAGSKATLIVNGGIGTDILSADFQEQLNSLDETVTEIHVDITTRGGSVIDGQAMFGMLRETGKRIVTTAIGGAYSAGAILLQAGDERRMHSNALLMIHGAQGGAGASTADDHRGAADMIDKANSVIAALIAERSGMSEARAAGILSGRDRWYTAREALAAGLIDTIIMNKAPAVAEFVSLVPDEILCELRLPAKQAAKPKEEPNIMAEATTKEPEIVAASSKEIKAACVGCSSDFVLAQIEADATMEQVKDAWIAELTSQQAAKDEAAAAEKERVAKLEADLAEAKASGGKRGVAPIGGNGDASAATSDDPIAAFHDAVKEKQGDSRDRQKAMSAVIAENPQLHADYLAAYREDAKQRLSV